MASIPVATLAQAIWLDYPCEVTEAFWRVHFGEGHMPRIVHGGRQAAHLQHMVAANLGVMLAPEHVSRPTSVVARPIEGDPIRRDVDLMVVAGRRYSPALDALVKVSRVRDWRSAFACSPLPLPQIEREEPLWRMRELAPAMVA